MKINGYRQLFGYQDKNKIFWRMLVTKQMVVDIDFHSREKKYNGIQWLPSPVWLQALK